MACPEVVPGGGGGGGRVGGRGLRHAPARVRVRPKCLDISGEGFNMNGSARSGCMGSGCTIAMRTAILSVTVDDHSRGGRHHDDLE
jgi:hypothetical protein